MYSTLVLNTAWPILMAYATYRVVLAVGHAPGRDRDLLVAGIGGALAWWGRVLYSFDVPLDWPFALTVAGSALMFAPKLWGIFLHERLIRR